MTGDWTYEEVAMAVGLRLLGEDLPEITRRLKRRSRDVHRVLKRASKVTGITALRIEEPSKRRREKVCQQMNGRELEQRPLKKKPGVFRRWRVNTRSHWPEHAGNVTADLMGDPLPGRSALSQQQR